MKGIKFEITEQDIRDYLIQPRKAKTVKNKEAMFVKYMKENSMITRESLEILMRKYNRKDEPIAGLYRNAMFERMSYELPDFDSYLRNIKNLDISGICHIMIPCIKYYDHSDFRHDFYLQRVNSITKKLGMNQGDEQGVVLLGAIDNYTLVRQIEDFKNFYRGFSRITMSKDKSRELIQAYSQIYGEEPVKQIRKIIREWV